jgi:transposase
MERNAMKRAPIPPCSSDLAPSDLCLFSHVKPLLRGYEFADREALLQAIEDILTGTEKIILENTFLSWMERFSQCGSVAGEYVE